MAADVGAASGDDDALNRVATNGTRFALSAVNANLQLEHAHFSCPIDVRAHRSTTGLNRLPDGLLNGDV